MVLECNACENFLGITKFKGRGNAMIKWVTVPVPIDQSEAYKLHEDEFTEKDRENNRFHP